MKVVDFVIMLDSGEFCEDVCRDIEERLKICDEDTKLLCILKCLLLLGGGNVEEGG